MGSCEHVCEHTVFRNRESDVMVGYELPRAVSIVVSTELEMKCAVLYFSNYANFLSPVFFFFTATKYQLSMNM
jgi:hypothetical protein